MPRISLKRTLLLITITVALTLCLINISHRGFVAESDIGNEFIRDVQMGHPEEEEEEMDRMTSEPWFMQKGSLWPGRSIIDPATKRRKAKLFPEEDDGDRIVNQLMFVPPNYPPSEDRQSNGTKLKKILLYHGLYNWRPLKEGREWFLANKCPVDTCEVVLDRTNAAEADAILFRDRLGRMTGPRPPSQVWILYLLECPYHTSAFTSDNLLNWTATYRHDSDIVTPYEKFVSYSKESLLTQVPQRNFAANKTKKVAWFVSNCAAKNRRKEYADELAKYIEVDIYGTCGQLQCPRTETNMCFDILNKNYKFYLSFENSNCKDYITEKFFVNGLGNDVVPIVMGARKEDYKRAAPPHSYIHVEDYASPKELAEYLHQLDQNDDSYNEYFRWKGTGEFVNTFFWCRVCALLHDEHRPTKVYEDINNWWRGPSTCVNDKWDD